MNNLILGTVQLGIPYGIANTVGQPNQAEANAIVGSAYNGGITFFDTAQAYGQSESVLGAALAQHSIQDKVHVITKLSPELPHTAEALKKTLLQSSKKLGVSRFYCVMLHREEQLPLLDGDVGRVLAEQQKQGLLEHIGISVYTPKKALEALRHPLISVIQLPANIFDRRFEQAGVFTLAEELSKEIHIRSVFLQGAVLMPAAALPACLAELVPSVQKLHILAQKYTVRIACLALGFMQDRYRNAKILFGAEAAWQVSENMNYIRQAAALPPFVWKECERLLPPQTAELLNPALWKR